jgi:predicted metal-dependent HD superfamily phosphohydrolase
MINMIDDVKESLLDIDIKEEPICFLSNIKKSYPLLAYHNWQHILHCYDEYIDCKGLFRRPSIGLMALLYHEKIYDPKRADNELRSALSAYEDIGEKTDRYIAAKISEGIVATMHNAIPYEPDTKLILDIDLSIFGKDWERFMIYDNQIRQEYSFLHDEEYIPARKKIMEHFLNRPSIYLSDYFKDKYEETATRNLERLILMLKIS